MVTATWRKGTYSKDKTGTEVTEHPIFVEEKTLTKNDTTFGDGITAHTWTLCLVSPSIIAKQIVAGDTITYLKHRYVVQNTATQKNRLAYNKFDTILYLL